MNLTSRLTAVLLAAGGLILAQPGRPRPNALVTALDADGDRTISAAEIQNAARALASLDQNRDGQLGDEELRPQFGEGGRGGPRDGGGGGGAPDDLVKSLMAFDANGDGNLTKSEVPERMQGLFGRGDKNNDGVLSADELKTMTASQPRRSEGGGGPGGGPPDLLRSALDADGDGAISAAELQAAPAALAKLDRNGDGVLNEQEYGAMGGGRGARGGGGGNPEEMYKRLLEENDANGDGKLAVSELPDRMREFLGEADADRDGFLSKEEMMAMRPREGRGGARGRRDED